MDNLHVIQMMQEVKHQDMIHDAKQYRIAKIARTKDSHKDRKLKKRPTFFSMVSRWMRIWLSRNQIRLNRRIQSST